MTKTQQVYIDKLFDYIQTHQYRFNNCTTIEETKDVLHKIIDEIEE